MRISKERKKFYATYHKLFSKLSTPAELQDFLNTLEFNFQKRSETLQSPRRVLQSGKAHCLEGALLAASVLRFHGRTPWLLDLRAKRPDDDHVVAVFRERGHYGAISKTNHGVLRFREPVYKSVRELAMSYFHEYFLNSSGRKTLREYSVLVDAGRFDYLSWETAEKDLWAIPKLLNKAKHFSMVPKGLRLRLADPVERLAGAVVEPRKKLQK